MKRINLKVFLLVLSTILVGCNKELYDIKNYDDLISVNLSLSAEVLTIDEPLTKSGESNALLGIQVYQNGSPYAYGLFDDISSMHIYLHSGKDYSFKAQYIKNGKELLPLLTMDSGDPCYMNSGSLHTSSDGDYWEGYSILGSIRHLGSNVYYFIPNSTGYGLPFCLSARSKETGFNYCTTLYLSSGRIKGYRFSGAFQDSVYPVLNVTNQFIYDDSQTISISNSSVQTNNALNIDRYYGEKTCLQVNSNTESITIEMKHLVYCIQCNVTGVTDGTASITIKYGNKVLLSKDNISGEYHSDNLMFAFSDMLSAWQYADNYTENVTVSMTWLRGVGVLQDLGSQVIQVKRNTNNVISVSLSTM